MVSAAVADVWDEWRKAVNTTAGDLDEFLDTDESKSVGDKKVRRRVHRSQVWSADRKTATHQEGGPFRGRRRPHAEGRRLRPPPPGAAAERRHHRLSVALLADELGPRPREVIPVCRWSPAMRAGHQWFPLAGARGDSGL